MANDSITFFCPACNTRLTVPGSLAGVRGPCPSCRALIQAPYPAPVQAALVPVQPSVPLAQAEYTAQHPGYQTPPPVYVQPAQPAQPAYPQQQPVYPSPLPQAVPSPAPLPIAQQPVQHDPYTDYAAVAATPPAPVPASPQSPAILRPEPRQLPSRSSNGESLAKQVPEAKLNSGNTQSPVLQPPPPRRRSGTMLLLGPLLFLTLTIALILGVWKVLKHQGKESHGNKGKLTESRIAPSRMTPACGC